MADAVHSRSVEQRERIEARLDGRLEELKRTRLAMHREGDGMRDSELAHVDNHPGDFGTDTHDEELDAEARRALAGGTYGICVDCHRPIPPERLKVVPEAVRCLDDQRLVEGLHSQHAPHV
jgi:RNA polymerase-binding transcription factor DksA